MAKKTEQMTTEPLADAAAQSIFVGQQDSPAPSKETSMVNEAKEPKEMAQADTSASGSETNKATETSKIEQPEIVQSASTINVVDPSTVYVAMNYPHNVKFTVPNRDGMMSEVELNGNATNLRGKKMGILPVGAYGITKVDADAWTYIKSRYAGLPLIRNGLIFATDRTERYAEEAAAEREAVRNGYEPVDPEKTATKPADKADV